MSAYFFFIIFEDFYKLIKFKLKRYKYGGRLTRPDIIVTDELNRINFIGTNINIMKSNFTEVALGTATKPTQIK